MDCQFERIACYFRFFCFPRRLAARHSNRDSGLHLSGKAWTKRQVLRLLLRGSTLPNGDFAAKLPFFALFYSKNCRKSRVFVHELIGHISKTHQCRNLDGETPAKRDEAERSGTGEETRAEPVRAGARRSPLRSWSEALGNSERSKEMRTTPRNGHTKRNPGAGRGF